MYTTNTPSVSERGDRGIVDCPDSLHADVPVRRVSLSERFAHTPKYFARDNDLLMSHLVAVLSAVFPDGEDFFVRTVRYYRDEIDDPELARDVRGFIGQESIHGREHRSLNVHLKDLGHRLERIELATYWSLRIRERVLPPAANLALTAALEHFTATLAEFLLTNDNCADLIGDDAVCGLMLWHALEEYEHKAVAFDVYRTVGGSERTRIITMKIVRKGFVAFVLLDVAINVALDPRSYKKGVMTKSVTRLRENQTFNRAVWKKLKRYDAQGFHPNDFDNRELVATWREKLFGEHGSMKQVSEEDQPLPFNKNTDSLDNVVAQQ